MEALLFFILFIIGSAAAGGLIWVVGVDKRDGHGHPGDAHHHGSAAHH
jgi:hypothetical protein